MNLYRAIYSVSGGDSSRHMTYAAPDYQQAQIIGKQWELADDRLWAVLTLRPIARPVFELNSI